MRRDPDKYAPEEDKGGFLAPCSSGHALKLLNSYMRTNLLKLIHGNVHKNKETHPRQSPLKTLIAAINGVLASWKETNLFECFNRNSFHFNPLFEFEAIEDFNHDIKLMTFHMEVLCQSLKRIKEV